MKKIIGIPGWNLGDNSFGVTKTYLHYLAQFGNVRILLPKDDIEPLDLLVLPGGMDLNPIHYNEVPGIYTSSIDVHKEYFYTKKLQGYIDNKTPIFGICLGFQMLIAKFGGSLEQHLMNHPDSPGRRQVGHKVKFKGVNMPSCDVNSHHHQGVIMSKVPDCFDIVAVEEYGKINFGEDRVVEAIIHKELPIAGVQWHPEEWYDEFTYETIINLMNIE